MNIIVIMILMLFLLLLHYYPPILITSLLHYYLLIFHYLHFIYYDTYNLIFKLGNSLTDQSNYQKTKLVLKKTTSTTQRSAHK